MNDQPKFDAWKMVLGALAFMFFGVQVQMLIALRGMNETLNSQTPLTKVQNQYSNHKARIERLENKLGLPHNFE